MATARTGGKTLRRLCAAKLAELDLPSPFDVNQFCASISRSRGRPIVLVLASLPERAPCGMWVVTDDTDYIFVQKQTSPLHQALIGLHELSHLLFGHTNGIAIGDHTARLLAPSLDPDVVKYMLGRTHYSAAEEREAEMLATVILSEAGSWSPPEPASDLPPQVTELVQRLEDSLAQGPRDRNV